MGNFYNNVTVGCADQEAVADAVRKAGKSAVITPVDLETIVVFVSNEESSGAEELAAQLSSDLGVAALSLLNHDDDILAFSLFRDGAKTDSYSSNPNFFYDAGEESPKGGDAAGLCAAFGSGDPEKAAEILRFDSMADDAGERYVCEIDRHADLVEAVGLSRYSVGGGYEYFEKGELPGDLDSGLCVVIPAGGD